MLDLSFLNLQFLLVLGLFFLNFEVNIDQILLWDIMIWIFNIEVVPSQIVLLAFEDDAEVFVVYVFFAVEFD